MTRISRPRSNIVSHCHLVDADSVSVRVKCVGNNGHGSRNNNDYTYNSYRPVKLNVSELNNNLINNGNSVIERQTTSTHRISQQIKDPGEKRGKGRVKEKATDEADQIPIPTNYAALFHLSLSRMTF